MAPLHRRARSPESFAHVFVNGDEHTFPGVDGWTVDDTGRLHLRRPNGGEAAEFNRWDFVYCSDE